MNRPEAWSIESYTVETLLAKTEPAATTSIALFIAFVSNFNCPSVPL